MPRRVRHEDYGAIHHVVPQGNGRRRFVLDDEDRRSYLVRFHRVACDHRWIIHASSLLDTHHHAVIETPEPNLGQGMRLLLGGHGAWFNDKNTRRGAVFGERYWSRRVSREGFLATCLYVLLNPVAAGLVEHPRAWEWCSYRSAVEDGVSDRLGQYVGSAGTDAREGFVVAVERAVARVHESRARDARATWQAASEVAARFGGDG